MRGVPITPGNAVPDPGIGDEGHVVARLDVFGAVFDELVASEFLVNFVVGPFLELATIVALFAFQRFSGVLLPSGY